MFKFLCIVVLFASLADAEFVLDSVVNDLFDKSNPDIIGAKCVQRRSVKFVAKIHLSKKGSTHKIPQVWTYVTGKDAGFTSDTRNAAASSEDAVSADGSTDAPPADDSVASASADDAATDAPSASDSDAATAASGPIWGSIDNDFISKAAGMHIVSLL